MQLRHIELSNFRAFYGRHELAFATDKARSVTVFHGENGAGKTNLLNAIYWCLTGKFTPRLNEPDMLVNKAALREERSPATYVELTFEQDGTEYRARRTFLGHKNIHFEVFQLKHSTWTTVPLPEGFIEKIIPKALAEWFFYDAEAIGALELSGDSDFKRSLRSTLGFSLVDTLLDDLGHCLTRRQKDFNKLVHSKDLDEVQEQIERKEHVLPPQREKLETVQAKRKAAKEQYDRINRELRELPQSRPLQQRRERLEGQIRNKEQQIVSLQNDIARALGEAAPAVLLCQRAIDFESRLQVKENEGKLPSPYSNQLVKEVLDNRKCICGRPVEPHSCEAATIQDLLKYATTGSLNARIREVQLLLRTIQKTREEYLETMAGLRQKVDETNTDIAQAEEELKAVKDELDKIDEQKVNYLERERIRVYSELEAFTREEGALNQQIETNENQLKQLRTRYDHLSKTMGQGARVRVELDKIKKISEFIKNTLHKQETRALNILLIELNNVLDRYLTKHYYAEINPSNYAVKMRDMDGLPVGDSTGEGQVLKFAFISTVVALAARKTVDKIEFMADPTVAPLVMDAPFSALDPEYQGSVARNLATQTSQLVLMISSAAWVEQVSAALEPHIGKEYIMISRQTGPQGSKPVKSMEIKGKRYILNEYGAERDETVFIQVG